MKLLQKTVNSLNPVLATAVGLQVVILIHLTTLLPPLLQPLLFLIGFLIVPGMLTSAILHHKSWMPIWRIFGIGIGFGIGEALLWGRILLTIGASTPILGYVILVTTLLKVVWLWRRDIHFRGRILIGDWRLAILPLLIFCVIILTMIQINVFYPAYPVNTFRLNDKWTYLTIIEQFLTSPSHLNLRPDSIIFGSNTRLAWNSWLYFTAAVSYFTHIHPIQLIFQYFRPGLFFLTFFSSYFLGYQLFRKHWLALLASVLQMLFLIGLNVEGFWFWMRLEEDKYFAFVTLMPIAWMFLLRTIETRRWPDVLGLMIASMSLALIHPLGIPGLLLTGAPIVGTEWLLNRHKGFNFRWLLIVLFSMGIFIGITIIDQKLVLATPYVQRYIAIHGSLPSYDVATVSNLLPVNARFIIVLLFPLAIFARKDRVARFLFLATVGCVVVLCVPIVTYLLSVFTTSVGIDRYNWLIPYGFIATWIILKLSKRLFRYQFKTRYLVSITAITLGAVILISSWHEWTTAPKKWFLRQELEEPTVLSEDLWQGFLETADDTDHKRAVTPTEYGLVAPTLWPNADLLIYNAPVHAPLNWPKIDALYQSQDIATTWMILDDLQPQMLLVPHGTDLTRQFTENPENVESVYSNSGVRIFTMDMPSDLREKNDRLAFVARQYTLKPGECTFLSWNSANLAEIKLNGQAVESEDRQEVCPSQNTVYTLQGKRADGSTVSQMQHIFVSQDYDYLASFDADRYVIKLGECVELSWHVEGIDKVYYQGAGTVGESTAKECPTANSLYSLAVILRNQKTIVRNITVYVQD